MNKAPDALWNDCLKLIRDNVTEQQFDTWFKPIVFESFNTATKTLLVQVPSPFVYEYLEENYVDLLSKVLKRIYGASVQLSYRIVTDKAHDVTVDLLSDSTTAQIAKPQPQTRGNQPPSVLMPKNHKTLIRSSILDRLSTTSSRVTATNCPAPWDCLSPKNLSPVNSTPCLSMAPQVVERRISSMPWGCM